ncbi:MAG: DEAD/DEAH box helicase [Sphingobacterium sp.]
MGYLIEPHMVQLSPNGTYSLAYQRVFSYTVDSFHYPLDATERNLIKLCDEIEQTHIIKRYHKKAVRPTDYFTRIFDKKTYDLLRPKIERKLLEILDNIGDKPLFLMSKDGYPADQELRIASKPTSILFHFRRNESETRYFPTLKHDGHRMEFMFRDAAVIVNLQAWLLLDQVLYHFDEDLEGKKLTPFLDKRFISISRSTERKYFETFVTSLIEKHHVYAEGFEIRTLRERGQAELTILQKKEGNTELQLNFRYGDYLFSAGAQQSVTVRYEGNEADDTHRFFRIRRSLTWEQQETNALERFGLQKISSIFYTYQPNADADGITPSIIEWLNEHLTELTDAGFRINQHQNAKKFVIGKTTLSLQIDEKNDWFDIAAVVRFGSFEIPFYELRSHILNKIQEFELPTGEVAMIPKEWFAQYEQLFQFSSQKGGLRLKKVHVGLLNEVTEKSQSGIKHKIQQLSNFEEIEQVPLPEGFQGSLRPYQQAGYNWFHFLHHYRFGGLLADDMGLGKTVQTLALLQYQKEYMANNEGAKTSLLIVPTSLIFNWQKEAERFTPNLRILLHTGTNRSRDNVTFSSADLVITTYGVARIDEALFASYFFNYIVLDESQNIKNPQSKSFAALRHLKGQNKLALSGTPIENSVADIWSQMTLVNPGLLGTFNYFQKEFVQPIEKKKDEEKARRLQSIIKPFILRRTKTQVATELPSKSEQIFYCTMTDEQQASYESVKSEYRNALLDGSLNKRGSQIILLQGLTKLRQLANHPRMVDEDYLDGSGKFDAAIETMESIIKEGNKVLIFSQFVRQLQIFKQYLEKQEIKFAYLDGATTRREAEVQRFKEDKEMQVFLISIKAGGVGLNLTEADYVFILDPWWNPAVEQQAIDRTHRIGQKKNVFIYKFITKDSIEEKIIALQGVKKHIAESLITTEKSFIKSLSPEDIQELFN